MEILMLMDAGTLLLKRPDQCVGRLIGYARVSTTEQNLDLQIAALERAGVHPDNIHVDKVSALARKRPGLAMALKDAVEGDVLVVWKLDRFGRSAISLLNEIEKLKARGIGFRSLTEEFDTTSPGGRFMMHMLAGAAQFERDMIAARTAAGIERVKAKGGKWGGEQVIDVKKARELFRKGWSVDQVRQQFRGTRGNKVASRQAVYKYFDGPTVWLLQGKKLADYPRKLTREQRERAIREARKK